MKLRSFLALVLLAAACVSPNENAAEVIPDVPYDLLGPSNTTTTVAVPEDEGRFDLDLFFLAEDNTLWRVTRAREQSPGIQEVLDTLVAGPIESEFERIPLLARLSESLNPIASQPIEGLLSITVDDEAQFRENNTRFTTQVLVCTMTQLANVDAIQLRDTVGPIPLSNIDSESIGEIANPADYNDCEAENIADLTDPTVGEEPGSTDEQTDSEETDG